MLKVEGHSDLYRDEETKAIINTGDEYSKYVNQRNARVNQVKEIEALKASISDIKSDMNDIKSMLALLLNK